LFGCKDVLSESREKKTLEAFVDWVQKSSESVNELRREGNERRRLLQRRRKLQVVPRERVADADGKDFESKQRRGGCCKGKREVLAFKAAAG
jgi:hypothetical protein